MGIGPKVAKALQGLELCTVGDVLLDFPIRYEDFRLSKPLALVRAGETVSVEGRLLSIVCRRSPRKRMLLTQAVVEDESGTLGVTWFGQPYLAKTLRVGSTLLLSGTADDAFGLALVNPQWEVKREGKVTVTAGRLAPLYSLAHGLSQKTRRQIIAQCLPVASAMPDILPSEVLGHVGLPALADALRFAHAPSTPQEAELALRRFAFEEVFVHQVALLQAKRLRQSEQGPRLPWREQEMRAFVTSLPFALTGAQRKAAFSVLKDMEGPAPMHRLLEGDVGSGKTVVAALAAFAAVKAGAQVAYAAPTELLASQQHVALGQLLGPHATVALLTSKKAMLGGEVVPRTQVLAALTDGRAQVVVGTHALFGKEVQLPDLALVIVDEQHRFGVEQRRTLLAPNHRGITAHFLAMTATPIPRTLALALHGDMALSVLDELPPNRGAVETILLAPAQDTDAFLLMEHYLAQGRQAYVVCPFIEESEESEAESVESMCRRLQGSPLGRFGIVGLHGGMKTAAKDEALAAFASGHKGLLVSTTVVEVGVNIANATVMFVEGAERFGLAQLHQLRGRVRRSAQKAVCFLHPSGPLSPVARQRLQALVESDDGFALAELDVRLRGEGERFGTRQSGLQEWRYAGMSHPAWIAQAQEAAAWYMNRVEGRVDHQGLRERLDRLGSSTVG
jgi:ATP-dependent DNA helicase RecG